MKTRADATTLSDDAERVPGRAWLLVVLCGFAGMMFYIDRQTLSVLKGTLKAEMAWSDTQYGWLVSAFMFSYTACYLFSGRWIDRWGTRKSMPAFLGVMSVATLCCGFAHTLPQMIGCRTLLGIADAGVVPAVMVAIVSWFPPSRRGVAATIKEPLNNAGQIIAPPLAAAFTQFWGWRSAFLVPGILGIGLAAAWWWADQRPRATASRRAASPPPPAPVPLESYGAALRRREIWGVIAARMVSDPIWFFLIYWEPGFLQDGLGMSLQQVGRLDWIPTAVAIVALMVLGAFSDRLIARRGWTAPNSRRIILQVLAVFGPVLAFLPFVRQPALAITLLCVVRIMMIVWLAFSNLFMADLVPQPLIGTSVALMSAFGAAMGLLCNTVIGPAIGAVGYGVIFFIGACLHPIAALILWRTYAPRFQTASRPQPLAPGRRDDCAADGASAATEIGFAEAAEPEHGGAAE